MLPFKLFQSKQILGLCFASFPVFWSDTDNWTFCMIKLSHAFDWFPIFFSGTHTRQTVHFCFVALYFTRLLLSGFSLCITRIKNLFFWKEIDKTFCCNCFFKILKTFWNIRLKANQMSLDLRYLLFQTRRALTGYYTAHSY